MDGPERLASYVVARRVQLGYRRRPPFAEAADISLRTLGDIETGRRDRYDPATIAALENTLGWTTGSIDRILSGREPILRPTTTATDAITDRTPFGYNDDEDEALIRVMKSNLPDAKKRQLVQMLIAEREEADRQRAERADQLIRLVGDDL